MTAENRATPRKRLGTGIILFVIAEGFFLTYIASAWLAAIPDHVEIPAFRIARYVFILSSYLCIAACAWLERDSLADFHFDRTAVAVLVLSSISLFRPRLHVSGETLFLLAIFVAGMWILVMAVRSWPTISKTNWRWVGISILLSVFLVIFILCMRLLVYHVPFRFRMDSLYHVAIFLTAGVSYQMSFATVTEEFIFRGFLWGYLVRRGWSQNQAMIFQAVVFWLGHPDAILGSKSIYAFLIFPTAIILQSLLVRNSRQLFPSIIMHTLYNIIVAA